ncbi:MAG: hypothetical protein HOB32_03025 [Nitrospina sp.]|jgi:hypothetical protein|nr:hypothetical protein [Nitrospina sp.]
MNSCLNSKKIFFKVLLCLFLLLPSFAIKAETWSCAYLFNGEPASVVYSRRGNEFYMIKGGSYKIVFEDNTVINLHNNYSPTYQDYFAVLLDKKKKMFAMVSLEIGNHTAIIEGPCEIN